MVTDSQLYAFTLWGSPVRYPLPPCPPEYRVTTAELEKLAEERPAPAWFVRNEDLPMMGRFCF
jgi:hypothetical protein